MTLFVTFEGIEGSGKSTQIRILNDVLKLRGYDTVLTREPGGTAIGEALRDILLSIGNKGMTPLCELFLYASARAQHVGEVIRPALEGGKIVLCDRFTDATVAYQGYGRGFSVELISRLNDIATDSLKPDVTFLLDCDAALGLKRVVERKALKKAKDDRFEEEPLAFHQRVREGYLAVARGEKDRFVRIDASQDVEAVHQEITRRILSLLSVQDSNALRKG